LVFKFENCFISLLEFNHESWISWISNW
jgi:hypothetical protein